MIQICICDDTIEDLEHVERLAKEFSDLHPEFPFLLRKFSSPYNLLDCIEEDGCFDLFLLDIIMPNIDGLELGRKIRDKKEPCEIIYLTSSREYGVDAFGVGAFNYLLKPIKKDNFERTMLNVMKRLIPSENPTILLKIKNGIRKLHIRDIVYIESFNHYRVVQLVTGESIRTDRTITSLSYDLTAYQNFQFSHRAYIVNLDYISGIMNKYLLLRGGYNIPISRSNYTDFKDTYLKYSI